MIFFRKGKKIHAILRLAHILAAETREWLAPDLIAKSPKNIHPSGNKAFNVIDETAIIRFFLIHTLILI